ncbi:MAG: GIY-YIG nuclease family protein [Hyphomicrobium sp.]
MAYWLYIVRCADGTLYTGIATDVARRICEHNGTSKAKKGARYTAPRRPVVLVYGAPFDTRSAASKEEARIKRLTRPEKDRLIATAAPQTAALARAEKS